ncbi:MAG TPA: hypothetical protein VG672_04215 [Bryobacteraceae bacterium]|nr:hypothetical protein [Bryobacteraceae bacterium]
MTAPPALNPILAGLDAEEKEAGLAVEMKAGLVLLDEARGRRVASEHFGLPVTGTLGVLDRAARAGLIGVADVRASPKLYQLLLEPATTRHKNEPKTDSRTREQEEAID